MTNTQTKNKTRLSAKNIALISIFSALWIALNLIVAPISFQLTGLPVIHSAIIFLTLLLTTWATGKYGSASLVGIIGSTIVLLAGGPLPVIGFAAAALLFDAILLANRHKLNMKPYNTTIAIAATIICAYFAGFINGIFIIPNLPIQYTTTIWGIWNIFGGIIGLAITLPIIGALEKANVKKIS
jgi:hypothetical protein